MVGVLDFESCVPSSSPRVVVLCSPSRSVNGYERVVTEI